MLCVITSDFSFGREYEVKTRNAMKCAQEYGRCEGGETVSIFTKKGKLVDRVKWTPEDGGRYYRCEL